MPFGCPQPVCHPGGWRLCLARMRHHGDPGVGGHRFGLWVKCTKKGSVPWREKEKANIYVGLLPPVFLERHSWGLTPKDVFLLPNLWIRKDQEGKEPCFYLFFTILPMLWLLLQLFLQARSFRQFSIVLFLLWLVLQLILYTVMHQLAQTSQTSAEICAPLRSGTQERLPSAWNAKFYTLWNGREFCRGLQGDECVAGEILAISWATGMKTGCLHKLWTVLVSV